MIGNSFSSIKELFQNLKQTFKVSIYFTSIDKLLLHIHKTYYIILINYYENLCQVFFLQ